MCNGFGFANIGEKLIAQSLAFGSPCNQASDINKLHSCWHYALWLDDFGQGIQARVGHGHYASVGFNGTERKVFRRYSGLGKRVKECGFADIRQAHNAAFETHSRSLVSDLLSM